MRNQRLVKRFSISVIIAVHLYFLTCLALRESEPIEDPSAVQRPRVAIEEDVITTFPVSSSEPGIGISGAPESEPATGPIADQDALSLSGNFRFIKEFEMIVGAPTPTADEIKTVLLLMTDIIAVSHIVAKIGN